MTTMILMEYLMVKSSSPTKMSTIIHGNLLSDGLTVHSVVSKSSSHLRCPLYPAQTHQHGMFLSLSSFHSLFSSTYPAISPLITLLCFRVKDEAAFEEVRGDYNSKNQVTSSEPDFKSISNY